MHRRLKERLIGAAVLVMLAVIFIPMILDDTSQVESTITDTNIPSRSGVEFNSRMIPVAEPSAREMPPRTAAPKPEADTPNAGTPGPAPVTGETAQQPEPVSTITGETPPAASATGREDLGLKAFVVQLGVFSDADNAESLSRQLRQAGFAAFVETVKQDGGLMYRVRVGPELKKSDAEILQSQIHAKLKLEGIIKEYP